MSSPRILVCVDWFPPGFRAGGPIQSSANFARAMRDVASVGVWTSDRDLGQDTPYADVEPDCWTEWEDGIEVCYASPSTRGAAGLHAAIAHFRPDWLYLNSMFSPSVALRPLCSRILGRLEPRIVLAPRGMLQQSALRFRAWKKRPTLWALRLAGLSRRVRFHATSPDEETRIGDVFGEDCDIVTVPNFPAAVPEAVALREKSSGAVRIVSVGRIHPIKNTHVLLEALAQAVTECDVSLVGPAEDAAYAARCRELAERLPERVRVHFVQELAPTEIQKLLRESHLFVLPTQGENFGHAIFEAMAAGVPVLISDQTLWRDLTADQAGWDLPLSSPRAFSEVINTVGAMSAAEHAAWVRGAHDRARRFVSESHLLESYCRMFEVPSPTAMESVAGR